jgi:hypothetical protein
MSDAKHRTCWDAEAATNDCECGYPERLHDPLCTGCIRLPVILSRAEHDALTADRRRLDWLADPHTAYGQILLPFACVQQNLGSLRAAIDATITLDTARDAAAGGGDHD